jgi:hypothetical protein
MDAFAQVGPEKGDYEFDLQHIANTFNCLGMVHVSFASLGTRHELVLVRQTELNYYGATPQGTGTVEDDEFFYCALTGHGANWLSRLSPINWSYFMEKYDDINETDAKELCTFLERFVECAKEVVAPN